MRVATTLLIRMLCSLALLVAALPSRANVAPCQTATDKPAAMACCKAMRPTMAEMPCCKAKRSHAKTTVKNDCKCAIKSAPTAPRSTEPRLSVSFEPLLMVAWAQRELIIAPPRLMWIEPGVFGIDSGPPPKGSPSSALGRAPPTFRA